MTVTELSDVTNKAKGTCLGKDDVASLFKCSDSGIVSLPDKKHIVVCVMHLLQIIGTEMGRMDPLFECVPELKGSVQEYTKCGELDDLDTSMKLVNFRDHFVTFTTKNDISIVASIAPKFSFWITGKATYNSLYWVNGELWMLFHSIKFCSDFWQLLMKALDTEVTRDYIKNNSILIENCKRKHGFVGMLNITCQLGGHIQLIAVDITPCIVSDNLDRYTALLRPRHYDNKQVGTDSWNNLELSSSQKDWDFLKFLQPELMCAYALVKMLRSLADTFQTKEGKVYTAEDILPSYMVKTALLWILDPEEKRSKIYKDLEINTVLDTESSSSYKDDVLGLCQELLHGSRTLGLDRKDVEKLMDIYEKCSTGTGHLTVRERILPYVLATRCSDRQQQNGINLQWMQENCNQHVQAISDQDERTESRRLCADSETERIWIELESDNKPVGKFSHHNIPYPDINEETAKKCQVWALRILRLLPHLLQTNSWIFVGRKTVHICGVRNYHLPQQEIHARDKGLAVTLCHILEVLLE